MKARRSEAKLLSYTLLYDRSGKLVTERTSTDITELKKYLVNFVGEQKDLKENEEVTVEMIVEIMAQEFPEFVLSVAEENFLRGYDQAISDIEHLKGLTK